MEEENRLGFVGVDGLLCNETWIKCAGVLEFDEEDKIDGAGDTTPTRRGDPAKQCELNLANLQLPVGTNLNKHS